ncbi:predicted protein [Nematostella vectensis]|uniref:Alpha-mannosidase n=1 Tax=Nematostella vectensis TaxID=45351 RepID=A7SFA1_NEMVE|nr:predicted protein [Nematostella vectensis]|eukprot:XP_001629647.1 predicted protein [Nematostella vectensis]
MGVLGKKCDILAVLYLTCFISSSLCFQCAEKGAGKDAEKLQIHIVPHTHDDVGWLKTVDEYFYGANNSIQHAGVQYILDSVIPALNEDPNKRFIYVEIAFFKRWWDQQNVEMQEIVKKLVLQKRLEFINGGWCMNDEAATHYNAIIDQMTVGLKFIEETFGSDARPRIAWHIDPFGHSNEQASLFAQMSFDGFFFGRIDYDDKTLRLKQQRMEMVWRGSKSGNLGKNSDIFTGVLYNGYNPPPGFCFDQFCSDQPIQDDPRLYDENVKQRVEEFIKLACEQGSQYKSNNIMMTMGSDFMYENANLWYKNLDKLIAHVNQDSRVRAFYSTPTTYLEALHAANLTWGLKTDDFFPYADCPHCYWTGYFTSRPALKRYSRLNNNLLQACKQLEVLNGPAQSGSPSSDLLRRALAVAQHHDAVSGTSKQHVADDYAKRLAIGAADCQALMSNVIGKKSIKSKGNAPPVFSSCNLLNVSSCPSTEDSKSFVVNAYNPIARDITSYIRVPVNLPMSVYNPQGAAIKSQLLPISQETMTLRRMQKLSASNSKYELIFKVKLPPLGFASYFVNTSKTSSKMYGKSFAVDPSTVIQNEFIKLEFSRDTGRLTSMTDLVSEVTTQVDQQFLWYNASVDQGQPSGAYIFRPNTSSTTPVNAGGKATFTVYQGPLVQEVRQVFSPYVSQVVRLYYGQKHAEFEYTVGPIPDDLGREVITRFDSDIKSNKVFYTDANGREMQLRTRDFRPTWKLNNTEPVAGNYYPVNSRIFVKDSNRQLTLLTDRSLGGSSLKDGSVELMLHRRLLVDDKRGVDEPLNESGISGKGLIVRGKVNVVLAPPATSAATHRELGEQMMLEPIVSFAQNPSTVEKWLAKYNSLYTGVARQLPSNVHMLTLETSNQYALIRLEHQFEADEDSKLSMPVNVSLQGLFTDLEVSKVEELNLAANQLLKDKHPMQWNIKSVRKSRVRVSGSAKQPSLRLANTPVELRPMQIRTFKATLRMKKKSKDSVQMTKIRKAKRVYRLLTSRNG